MEQKEEISDLLARVTLNERSIEDQIKIFVR